MKKVVILQSNYIPWKGYFDLINMADVFVIYDEVQYTKNDWRNRNKIKTQQGSNWITIPVKHSIEQRIDEIEVVDNRWRKKHWKTLKQFYSKAEYFNRYKDIFYNLYLGSEEMFLSKINYEFIKTINELLGIKTRLKWSADYNAQGEKTERLVDICRQEKATEYVSGPSAKDYLQEERFEQAGIKVSWMDYSGYPEYKQLYPPFEHQVSIIDLIFNEGPNATRYMKSF